MGIDLCEYRQKGQRFKRDPLAGGLFEFGNTAFEMWYCHHLSSGLLGNAKA
ncbi:hypothetical protein [Catenovulum adriaticum]|uniref:Uncharacterized protein n=1 Tax=Catenovulum adriaticum TaxID=2984846 RepID=A0ABY7AJL8_9ALTE|nr:hypothetical protein [Catenovulum sp. TS8]WAJ69748.1 hypothetical protein OLW01_11365 [Catenovulum sp. TS8]